LILEFGGTLMATDVRTRPITAEEFMGMDLGEGTFELVRGEVIQMPPPRTEHGIVCGNVAGILWTYGRQTRIGYMASNDSGVVTERGPDTVRGADVSFYTEARWPRAKAVGKALPPVPPDLAVEVVSPSNRPGEIAKKVREYLAVGTPLVWVVDPARRTVIMHRPGQSGTIKLGDADTIEGLAELPGFRCPVADFFL
jgi:Uma2 family endonuclease